MRFCNKCDNMFYIRISDDDGNSLTHYCRNCGNEESNTQDEICVSKTNFKRNEDKYYNIINKYAKYDPTIPHTDNIPCPNNKCISVTNKEIKSDVIFKRYDEDELKYVYLCCHCDNIWHNNNLNE
tara:strand:+ start:3304 stop:3678 length:375 start_codon:yes stop_codon:yes gene_type:complete